MCIKRSRICRLFAAGVLVWLLGTGGPVEAQAGGCALVEPGVEVGGRMETVAGGEAGAFLNLGAAGLGEDLLLGRGILGATETGARFRKPLPATWMWNGLKGEGLSGAGGRDSVLAGDDAAGVGQGLREPGRTGFDWTGAFQQSFLFLAIQHGWRFALQPDTRAEMQGPFFQDWFDSVRNLRGWDDGDGFLINYIGHSMMGAVTGFIQVQNDPRGRGLEVGQGREYWKSRSKALLWSTIYSVQFELGPVSEASLGNVGRVPTKESDTPMAYIDLVVTPVMGTAWLVGEDLLDRYFISRLEQRTGNRVARMVVRSLFNPSRSFANLMRMKKPWYRDTRSGSVSW